MILVQYTVGTSGTQTAQHEITDGQPPIRWLASSESRASPCQQLGLPFPDRVVVPAILPFSFPRRMLQDAMRPGYRWKMSSLELAVGCEHEFEKH